MEDNKNGVSINIEHYDGAKPIRVEITNREGEAPAIRQPKKVIIAGNIYSVREFITKQLAGVTGLQFGHIIIENLDKVGKLPTIKLDTSPAMDGQGHEITSSLDMNSDFGDFQFNKEDAGRTTKQLISFLRSHSHCFSSVEEVRALIKKLQNQEVKFEQIASQEDDRKGKIETSIKEQLKITKGELPDVLNISVPFFNGTPMQSIQAEIEIDRRGTIPVFSFYCLGIEADVMNTASQLVKDQIVEASEIFTIYYK